MSNAAATPPQKAAKTTPSEVPPHPIIARPIAHAYALVPDPTRPGRYFAVHLTEVVAGKFEHLEPSGRSDIAPRGLMRIEFAMEERHRKKQWGWADD